MWTSAAQLLRAPHRAAGRDWRTTLLGVLFATATTEVVLGLALAQRDLLAIPTSTMVAVASVWAVLSAWCLLRRRLREGEALVMWCSVATMLALESVFIQDATWREVCRYLLAIVPVAAVLHLQRSRLVLVTALVAAGEVAGVLATQQRPVLAAYTLTAVALCVVAPVLVVSVLLQRISGLQALAEQQARTDVLTGLLNRRGLLEVAPALVRRAQREELHLGVMVADLDRFKAVNDTRGHLVGDAVLSATAATLLAHVRPGDAVVRLGGEEVAVLGCWPTRDAVARAAERLRAAVEAQVDVPVRVTVSIGTATARPAAEHVRVEGAAAELVGRLVDEADQALYAAKRAGRNRVEHSPPTPAAPGPPAAPAHPVAPAPRRGA